MAAVDLRAGWWSILAGLLLGDVVMAIAFIAAWQATAGLAAPEASPGRT